MMNRERLSQARRVVIKLGSAILTGGGQGIDRQRLGGWAADIAAQVQAGCEVVIVSSGAVATGMQRTGRDRRPAALPQLQALAAIGQMGLVQAYESAFQAHGYPTAQILLTHDDLVDRERYLNARSALRVLLDLGAIPVVNENDTVATEEIRFGDNDTLAALVANLVDADVLVILTDQAGLFDRNPREHSDAKLIEMALADDPSLLEMAGEAGQLGRGGMRTKVLAARKAARSGTLTVIAAGAEPSVITRVLAGENIGTVLVPGKTRVAARKQWLGSGLAVGGELTLDAGAVAVLRGAGRSLLAVGVTAVTGEFGRGALVACRDADGREVARGLVNYGSADVRRIMGRASDEIESLLGYAEEPELIHRDNLLLL